MTKALVSFPGARAWRGARRMLPAHGQSSQSRSTPPAISRHPVQFWDGFASDAWDIPPLHELAPPLAELPNPPATAMEGLEYRFRRLAETWHEETDFLSSPTAVFMHSAYQEIIGMGPAVLPILLRDLRLTRSHWFWALRVITGENPVPPGAAGNLERMAEAWLAWGRERGLV